MVHCMFDGSKVIFSKQNKKCISFYENPFSVNSVDPDEMPHKAAFHLGLHCFPKYPFRGFRSKKV